ncbi:hypothetical protein E1181_28520 [Saccharopolyspora terrae]|uniref:Terpene synthase n=1 Tax=Saccharopolyspora terrae TaxID=2530384 RepID=A0A4R4V569_9PSEU|nr:hypothetical protein [Saccharopolyspora terrae]TDC99951.1 hypothetical protein E1181_28520 [Saccharopolyspora terrae]
MSRWPIPELYCPFDQTADPELADGADVSVRDWYRNLGLFQAEQSDLRWHEQSKFGLLATLSYPDVVNFDYLVLGSQYLAMQNAMDDLFDDCQASHDVALVSGRLHSLISTLHEPLTVAGIDLEVTREPACDPTLVAVLAAVRDVMERLGLIASPAQLGRARRELIVLVSAWAEELAWRSQQREPTLREYLAHRQRNGLTASVAIADALGGYEVPPDEIESFPVRELIVMSSNIAMLINDLYPAEVESKAPTANYNLPSLLARQGRTLENALVEVGRIHDAELRKYLKAEREVASSASPELRRYLQSLRGWIRGNLDWSRRTARYKVEYRPAVDRNKVSSAI